jgi:hypothetical protein
LTIRLIRGSTEGAGSISWGAKVDRLAPLGEEAVSIIKEAWERRQEDPRERAKREAEESEPVDRGPSNGASIKPGWCERVEFSQYWIHMTPVSAHQPAMGRGPGGELVAWGAGR